ncbi:hypothetical protein C8R43DRAFT_962898 [Mycena crocata]|nr:hypothetical protein C8R43DRAFT_962898 [Mycena crocata]
MCLAWLQAKKPRSQSPGFAKPSQAKVRALRGLWLWLQTSEAKSRGLKPRLRILQPSRTLVPKNHFSTLAAQFDNLQQPYGPEKKYKKKSPKAGAWAKAKPSQALPYGFGFGFMDMEIGENQHASCAVQKIKVRTTQSHEEMRSNEGKYMRVSRKGGKGRKRTQNSHYDGFFQWVQKPLLKIAGISKPCLGCLASEDSGISLYRTRGQTCEAILPPQAPRNRDKSPVDVVGTLVVILPALFTGGEVECRYGIQSKTLDFAPESQLLTSVFAAYSAVEIACRPITSGYRLSLTYDILDPQSTVPPLPNEELAVSALRDAVVSWAESDEADVAAYFLQRSYHTKHPHLHALIGSDAVLAAHLICLAAELEVQVYVVRVVLYQSKYGRYKANTVKLDPRKITDLDVQDELTGLGVHVVDAEGVPVRISRFDFRDLDHECYLNGELEDGRPVRQYEEFGDDQIRVDEHIYLDAEYYRTLVLFWPTSTALESPKIRYSQAYAASALQASASTTPSHREQILVNSLQDIQPDEEWDRSTGLRNEKEEKLDAGVRAMCKCAVQWSDLDLLLATLGENEVAKNLDLIGIDTCAAAYRTFGWDALKDFFAEAVQKAGSNPQRQALVTRLGEVAADVELQAWCKEQQNLLLRSLNGASISEVDWLLAVAAARGADFLRDMYKMVNDLTVSHASVYPQLEAQQLESEFWVHFVRRLVDSPISMSLGIEFARQCVLQATDNLPAFPTCQAQDALRRPIQKTKTGSIMDVLRLCVETAEIDLCARVFDKMQEAARSGTFSADVPPWKYYLELTLSLDAYLASSGEADFQPFFKEAAVCILTSSPTRDQPSFSPCPFTTENLATLVVALRRAGGLSFLDGLDKNVLLAGRDTDSLKALVTYLVAEFQPQPGDPYDHAALFSDVVRQAIDVFDMGRFHSHDATGKLVSVDEMIAMLKFCSDAGAQSLFQHLLVHFVTPPLGISIAQHVSIVLAPFIPALRDYLASGGLDFESPPFKSCAARVVEAFAGKVMCQKPQELIVVEKIGCQEPKCSDCKTLRDFFAGDDRIISLPRAAKLRQHIESQLEVPKTWGVQVRLVKEHACGSPHRLEITKPENMTEAGLWVENSQRGKALLAALGDAGAQRRILGPAHERVVSQLCEKATSTAKKRPADDQSDTAAKKPRTSTS